MVESFSSEPITLPCKGFLISNHQKDKWSDDWGKSNIGKKKPTKILTVFEKTLLGRQDEKNGTVLQIMITQGSHENQI